METRRARSAMICEHCGLRRQDLFIDREDNDEPRCVLTPCVSTWNVVVTIIKPSEAAERLPPPADDALPEDVAKWLQREFLVDMLGVP
mgnify:FL=1